MNYSAFINGPGGTVTLVSVTTANGVSGTVLNATTTPAITLTLGAITPTSVNGVAVSGSSTPTLAVSGTTSVSGSNTGDQTNITGNAGTVSTINGLIVQGTNVTITGSGTSGSPYNISATGGGSSAFSSITSGTNTTAAMVVGSGASIAVSGTGTIAATSVTNATLTTALTVNTGTLTLTANSANTSVLTIGAGAVSVSGTNTGDQTITLTGDVTGSGTGSFVTTVAKVAGTTVSGATGTTNVVFSDAPTLVNPVVGTQTASDNSTKGASTAYVTTAIGTAIAGINPAVAVQFATTLASDTSAYTYNNGASGIGATLTGANNVAFTADGQTASALLQRVLIKNDTQSPSGAFNGVYYVSQLQTAILPPILTRALDYDMPSDINNTGAIPVVNGTANTSTSWLLTSSVTTVGTNPLTYTKFSINPSTVVTLTDTQTLTNKRITRRFVAVTQSATPAINTDNTDIASITALAQAITSMTSSLSGTPVAGDYLMIQITDNGTARGITWGTSFAATTIALPTTTVISTLLRVGFQWDTVATKWQCIATC